MMDAPKASARPPQPRHEDERAHKKTEHEEEQPRARDEAGQARANVPPLICAVAESNPRSDKNASDRRERAGAQAEPARKSQWRGRAP